MNRFKKETQENVHRVCSLLVSKFYLVCCTIADLTLSRVLV